MICLTIRELDLLQLGLIYLEDYNKDLELTDEFELNRLDSKLEKYRSNVIKNTQLNMHDLFRRFNKEKEEI